MATSFYPLSFSVCAPLCINTREKIFKCFVCMSENRSAAACFLVTCFLRPQDTFVDFEHRPVAMCGQKHKKKKKEFGDGRKYQKQLIIFPWNGLKKWVTPKQAYEEVIAVAMTVILTFSFSLLLFLWLFHDVSLCRCCHVLKPKQSKPTNQPPPKYKPEFLW